MTGDQEPLSRPKNPSPKPLPPSSSLLPGQRRDLTFSFQPSDDRPPIMAAGAGYRPLLCAPRPSFIAICADIFNDRFEGEDFVFRSLRGLIAFLQTKAAGLKPRQANLTQPDAPENREYEHQNRQDFSVTIAAN